jgi:hypothetical protein
MPHFLDNAERFIGHAFRNALGHTECVTFLQSVLHAPHTSLWREGDKIEKGKTYPAGTPIATFENGHYAHHDRHAAIYVGQNAAGILVLDQWNAKGKVTPRTIYWNRHGRIDNGSAYSVIEW